MTTFQQYQQQFVQAAVAATQIRAVAPPPPLFQPLLEALPYYGDPDFLAVHRGALANLLMVYMPNAAVAPQGRDMGIGYVIDYYYTNEYTGYQNAFYHAVAPSPVAANLLAAMQAIISGLNPTWWGAYGVAALTDAVKQTVGVALDTGKLAGALVACHSSILPALAAGYLAIYTNGFTPTAAALGALQAGGEAAAAGTQLVAAITSGEFTANINQAIAMGGDSAAAAIWFLFNLWITLKALGNADVDGAIGQFAAAGLTVPAEVGQGTWWSGGYTSWYLPLSGSDVAAAAADTINRPMPELVSGTTIGPTSGTNNDGITVPNGYCISLTTWGSLNWYLAGSSSCLGQGTGVLLADGSVKPIEQVAIGDAVQTSLGPRKVVLVEAPPRGDRPLYQPNGLSIFATAAHPFRTAQGMLGARAAVDPWALIDSVATVTEQGVAALASGCRLEGWGPQGPEDVTVASVRKLDAPAEGGGCVYDLVLERWEKGMPCYYVGGPHTFLAVEAETANPFHEPPVTVAVVTALRAAVAHSRQYVSAPAVKLPDLLHRVEFGKVRARAHATAAAEPRRRPPRPKVPDPQFYTDGGAWCPHASLLEGYLVRHFAFRLRREAVTGWRLPPSAPQADDHLAVTVLDLHLLGEVPVPRLATVAVELRLCGAGRPAAVGTAGSAGSTGSAEDVVRTVSRRIGRRRAWLVRLDEVVEFGRFPQAPSTAFLLGSVTIDGVEIGRFRAAVPEHSSPGGAAEHFLFDPGGKVIGRIALDTRRISAQDLQCEQEQRRLWTRRHAGALAVHLGREIGGQLVSLLEPRSTGTSAG